jgi:SAM-dependent methyltransferase
MTEDLRSHWETLYTDKAPDQVSWYQAAPTLSLTLLAQAKLRPGSMVADLGSGVSPVVGALLAKGHLVTAVDISAPALAKAKQALGEESGEVEWVVADVCHWRPNQVFDLWHDRAVFHFMTTPEQRAGYLQALKAGLKPGGSLVMATFALDGPESCSGLDVQRYDADTLMQALGPGFTLLARDQEHHKTPKGSKQKFNYCLIRRG